MTLKLDFCDSRAARYACTRWHYSKSMPTHPRVHIGVWEDDSFRGVVIFSRGASRNLASNFKLEQTEVAELTRIALREHRAPDGKRVHSRMVTKAGWTYVYGKYRRVLTPDQCTRVELPPKHKYAFPLDAEIRSQLMEISKPYPKKSQPAAVV